MASRCYTKHGMRAHYAPFRPTMGEFREVRTYCGKVAYTLSERSRFWRRRLAQASMCSRCESMEELEQAIPL